MAVKNKEAATGAEQPVYNLGEKFSLLVEQKFIADKGRHENRQGTDHGTKGGKRQEQTLSFFFVLKQDVQDLFDLFVCRPGAKGAATGTGMTTASEPGQHFAYVDMALLVENAAADADLYLLLLRVVKPDFYTGNAFREK